MYIFLNKIYRNKEKNANIAELIQLDTHSYVLTYKYKELVYLKDLYYKYNTKANLNFGVSPNGDVIFDYDNIEIIDTTESFDNFKDSVEKQVLYSGNTLFNLLLDIQLIGADYISREILVDGKLPDNFSISMYNDSISKFIPIFCDNGLSVNINRKFDEFIFEFKQGVITQSEFYFIIPSTMVNNLSEYSGLSVVKNIGENLGYSVVKCSKLISIFPLVSTDLIIRKDLPFSIINTMMLNVSNLQNYLNLTNYIINNKDIELYKTIQHPISKFSKSRINILCDYNVFDENDFYKIKEYFMTLKSLIDEQKFNALDIEQINDKVSKFNETIDTIKEVEYRSFLHFLVDIYICDYFKHKNFMTINNAIIALNYQIFYLESILEYERLVPYFEISNSSNSFNKKVGKNTQIFREVTNE